MNGISPSLWKEFFEEWPTEEDIKSQNKLNKYSFCKHLLDHLTKMDLSDKKSDILEEKNDEQTFKNGYKFSKACKNGDLKSAKYLYSLGGIDIHEDEENALYYSCVNGHLKVAKWLFSLGGVDLHVDDDEIFRWSCDKGRLKVAKWLYSLGGIDIHAKDDFAFRSCCNNGHLGVAKWLYSLGDIDIFVNNGDVFRLACKNGHINIAKWLSSIDSRYIITEKCNKIIEYKIL